MKPFYYKWFEESSKFAYEFSRNIQDISLEWRVCIKKEIYHYFGYNYFRHFLKCKVNGLNDSASQKNAFKIFSANLSQKHKIKFKLTKSPTIYKLGKEISEFPKRHRSFLENKYDIIFEFVVPFQLKIAKELIEIFQVVYNKKILIMKNFKGMLGSYSYLDFGKIKKSFSKLPRAI